MSNFKILLIFSPLLLFVVHTLYLVVFDPKPFFTKWVDGCFSFFLALVMCNLVRARIAPRVADEGVAPDADARPSPRRERDGA